MTDTTQDEGDLDLESLWNESDDDGNLVTPGQTPASTEPDSTDVDNHTDNEGDQGDDSGDKSDEDQGDAQQGDQEDDSGDIDWKALYEKSQHEVKTTVGRLKALESKVSQPQESRVQTPAVPAAPSEEDDFLSKFTEKYSDEVVRAIDLITSRKTQHLVDTSLNQRLTPVEDATAEILTEAHFGAIESVHPDIEAIDASPIFESWIQTRPAHLKATYEFIREHGTPGQVIAMVTEYKETIGATKKNKPTVPSNTTKVDKVIAATGVGRKRGTVSTAALPDANDVQAIWDETDD